MSWLELHPTLDILLEAITGWALFPKQGTPRGSLQNAYQLGGGKGIDEFSKLHLKREPRRSSIYQADDDVNGKMGNSLWTTKNDGHKFVLQWTPFLVNVVLSLKLDILPNSLVGHFDHIFQIVIAKFTSIKRFAS